MKLTEKGRLILYICILAILMVITCAMLVTNVEPTYEVSEQYIRPGDTLDGIATKYCSSKQDKRKYIYEVMQLNDRTIYSLQTGETIKIYKEIER
jgi:hypothetical protein